MSDLQESSGYFRRLAFPVAEIPSDVGDRVREAREARSWSKTRLAGRAGIDRASVQRLEAGGSTPRADTLFRIAHVLDLTINDLVPGWPEWEPLKGVMVGDETRVRRRARGMSLAELAAIAGVSEATMSRHERGLVASRRLVARVGGKLVVDNPAMAAAVGMSARV